MDGDYYGWGGFGGSKFMWSPKERISVAYVPSDLIPFETDNRGLNILAEFMKVYYER